MPKYQPKVGEECVIYFSNDSYPRKLKCVPILLADYKSEFMIEDAVIHDEVMYVRTNYSYDLRKSASVIFTKKV